MATNVPAMGSSEPAMPAGSRAARARDSTHHAIDVERSAASSSGSAGVSSTPVGGGPPADPEPATGDPPSCRYCCWRIWYIVVALLMIAFVAAGVATIELQKDQANQARWTLEAIEQIRAYINATAMETGRAPLLALESPTPEVPSDWAVYGSHAFIVIMIVIAFLRVPAMLELWQRAAAPRAIGLVDATPTAIRPKAAAGCGSD